MKRMKPFNLFRRQRTEAKALLGATTGRNAEPVVRLISNPARGFGLATSAAGGAIGMAEMHSQAMLASPATRAAFGISQMNGSISDWIDPTLSGTTCDTLAHVQASTIFTIKPDVTVSNQYGGAASMLSTVWGRCKPIRDGFASGAPLMSARASAVIPGNFARACATRRPTPAAIVMSKSVKCGSTPGSPSPQDWT